MKKKKGNHHSSCENKKHRCSFFDFRLRFIRPFYQSKGSKLT